VRARQLDVCRSTGVSAQIFTKEQEGMCGRFTLRRPDLVAERFQAQLTFDGDITSHYNIAPSQTVPIVAESEDGREVRLARWGLIPSWAKDPSIGNRLINARAETLSEKPSFRSALRQRRCLVPADGFFEWQKTTAGRTPFFLQRRDGDLFAFAGLYETWRDPQGHPVTTCTIITTQPNDLLLQGGLGGTSIHDRMPAMLSPDDEAVWLSPAAVDADLWRSLLMPYPDHLMQAYPVSTLVNSPANDTPSNVIAQV
jgi:putative SOS response-associated peptidase YedK